MGVCVWALVASRDWFKLVPKAQEQAPAMCKEGQHRQPARRVSKHSPSERKRERCRGTKLKEVCRRCKRMQFDFKQPSIWPLGASHTATHHPYRPRYFIAEAVLFLISFALPKEEQMNFPARASSSFFRSICSPFAASSSPPYVHLVTWATGDSRVARPGSGQSREGNREQH